MPAPFRSWFMGGFECSTHHRHDGRRLDLIDATGHDRHALDDYAQLAAMGIRTIRDGVRWHRIEADRRVRDWTSLYPMLAAAAAAGVQVIWDLLHYGWPDWASPWDEGFAERFADFAAAAARRIGPGGLYVPVNEISFHSWAGGEVGVIDPFAHGRGNDLKVVLARAAILASHAIRTEDPAATILCAEPLIRVHPAGWDEAAVALAARLDAAQFDALDMWLGRRMPELGGAEDLVDLVGLNYYPHNQWRPGEPVATVPLAEQVPLSGLLATAAARYGKPLLITETGCEDEARAPWLAYVAGEAARAQASGVDLRGLCLYPVMDHPGWADDRHCRNGLICGLSPPPRPVHTPMAMLIAEKLIEVSPLMAEQSRGPTVLR